MNLFEGGQGTATAQDRIGRYFRPGDFTGSQFELIANSDEPDEITPRDLIAVSMLGVNVPARVAVWSMNEDGRHRVGSLLRQVPSNLDIWEAEEHLTPRGALWELWFLLQKACWPTCTQSNGVGDVICSKLLAAKRPRLVPIQDRRVVELLPSTRNNYWADYCTALSSPERRDVIKNATSGAPDRVSLLRRIDVVLWMTHRDRTGS